MARTLKTPGETTTTETEVDTSNVPTLDAATLNATTSETEAEQAKPETTTSETEVTASSYLLKQILNNQARIEKKIDSLIKAGGIESLVPKKQKWVQGKHGMELQDV
ncbi:hypothetical protein HX005_06805 [Acinetobacter sp. R933-2]|uniref:hypothetical protein n=1 Tax=Acinetobacter sp. R933-2 TaxID=2746728 RepID=UPI0025776BCF|nr:hypothetical protein [Acinetobacter sp. R933-2]MDM1247091.1 hypothetical protein [Acinetobacter sp. R933-2]